MAEREGLPQSATNHNDFKGLWRSLADVVYHRSVSESSPSRCPLRGRRGHSVIPLGGNDARHRLALRRHTGSLAKPTIVADIAQLFAQSPVRPSPFLYLRDAGSGDT